MVVSPSIVTDPQLIENCGILVDYTGEIMSRYQGDMRFEPSLKHPDFSRQILDRFFDEVHHEMTTSAE